MTYGRTRLGGVAGTIELDVGADVMADVIAMTDGVYDLELVPPSGEAHAFKVTPEVTM